MRFHSPFKSIHISIKSGIPCKEAAIILQLYIYSSPEGGSTQGFVIFTLPSQL